jgi:hypothetical protein
MCWVTLGQHLDFLPIDKQRIGCCRNLAGETAIGGVLFQEMSIGFGIRQIVDRHSLKLMAVTFQDCFRASGVQYARSH